MARDFMREELQYELGSRGPGVDASFAPGEDLYGRKAALLRQLDNIRRTRATAEQNIADRLYQLQTRITPLDWAATGLTSANALYGGIEARKQQREAEDLRNRIQAGMGNKKAQGRVEKSDRQMLDDEIKKSIGSLQSRMKTTPMGTGVPAVPEEMLRIPSTGVDTLEELSRMQAPGQGTVTPLDAAMDRELLRAQSKARVIKKEPLSTQDLDMQRELEHGSSSKWREFLDAQKAGMVGPQNMPTPTNTPTPSPYNLPGTREGALGAEMQKAKKKRKGGTTVTEAKASVTPIVPDDLKPEFSF